MIARRRSSPEEREQARADIGWTDERGPGTGQTFVPNMRRWTAEQGWIDPLPAGENPQLGAGYWRQMYLEGRQEVSETFIYFW